MILTRQDVQQVLTMDAAVEAVQRAFAASAGDGDAQTPPKMLLTLDKHAGDFRAMPAYLDGSVGVKWVNSHPKNPTRHGLPSVMGMYILSDPDTALPLAVMDATLLTAVRTGAAAAVASKHLARKSPTSLGIIGCGAQAPFLLAAHQVVFGDLDLYVADAVEQRASAFAAEANGSVGSAEQVAGCDIVCTATTARAPVVAEKSWVRQGAHINAVGADAPGKQELSPDILAAAKVVVDDYEQATEAGELNVAVHAGVYARGRIYGTIGEIVVGKKPGRCSAEEITLFDSTGMSIQDIALARLIYDVARQRGVGTEAQFVS
jgi:alanine dehydrogenase